MSLGWVITGTIAQLILSFFLFMMVAFSGGSLDGKNLGQFQRDILDFSIYALPFSCILSAGIVGYLYNIGANSLSYWWHGLPIILAALYVKFVLSFSD